MSSIAKMRETVMPNCTSKVIRSPFMATTLVEKTGIGMKKWRSFKEIMRPKIRTEGAPMSFKIYEDLRKS